MDKSDWLVCIPIAHRGVHNDRIPENSLEAFELAVCKHYAIELDVQMTKDKHIVVFHDYDTKRMLGRERKISESTLSELRACHLPGSKSGIPTLAEVLTLVGGRTPILIEIKNDETPGELETLLCEMLAQYKGLYAIQCFNPLVLRAIRCINPEMIRGQLSSDYSRNRSIGFVKKILLKHFMLNFISKPHFIAYDIRALPNRQISEFREKGMPVIGWTVRNQSDYEISKAYCDNCIFEEQP